MVDAETEAEVGGERIEQDPRVGLESSGSELAERLTGRQL